MKHTNKILAAALLMMCASGVLFSQEKKKQAELSLAMNLNFGCYKETTFANISHSLLAPRFQLDSKIYSGNFLHIITADYFFCRPDSAMTRTTVLYKTYDPISGTSYYEPYDSSLFFHRIRLQYDMGYSVLKNEKMNFYVGGNFACNAYLQFENYPSITGLISLGTSAAFKYQLNEHHSIFLTSSIPLLGYGVRPSYAGCDAQLMKYAEEDFMKILTLGNFISLHNYQSLYFDFEYKYKIAKHFSAGLGFEFEYSRIAVPQERPLYFVDGSINIAATVTF